MKITKMVVKEKHIEEIWEDRSNKNYTSINNRIDQLALDEFIKYIDIDDLYRNTSNGEIVKLLYFEKPKINLTEICRKEFMDEKTLYRHRKNYIKLFDLIFSLCTNQDISGKNCPMQK